LRIPGVNGFPDCGTEKYGDTLSNVVVVQFSEAVQTAMDLAYNLTCTITGPRDITVTSGTLGAGYYKLSIHNPFVVKSCSLNNLVKVWSTCSN